MSITPTWGLKLLIKSVSAFSWCRIVCGLDGFAFCVFCQWGPLNIHLTYHMMTSYIVLLYDYHIKSYSITWCLFLKYNIQYMHFKGVLFTQGVIHRSATTLKPLTCEVINDILVTMQCSAGKSWVLTSCRCHLTQYSPKHCRRPSTPPQCNSTPQWKWHPE